MSGYGFIFKNQDKNTQYKMLELGDSFSFPELTNQTIDIRFLFPHWILERSSSSSIDNYFVDFVQAYYDWLYSKSGYELTFTDLHSIGLLKLVDIEDTPVEFLPRFSFSYAGGISNWNVNTDQTDVRMLIKGIRSNLYQKKSNEESYRYFFQSLYGSNSTDIVLTYPKQNIMRLNGGRFKDENWGTSDTTGYYENVRHLGASFLNSEAKIQDSYWYQDFSYLLKAGTEYFNPDTGLPIYFNDLQVMLHPAGLQGFFEKTTQDYIPPDGQHDGIVFGEEPALQNYFPYRLDDIVGYTACIGCSGSGFGYDGPTAHIGSTPYDSDSHTFGEFGGASGGWTMGNVWSSIGGGGIGAEFNSPTHHWPNWDDDIADGVMFGDINIREFIYLYPALESPNLGMTGCTASGGTGACY
jgi:hypothetical protein